MSAAKLPTCLWGAGLLGHTWLVTFRKADGSEHMRCQSPDAGGAIRSFDEMVEHEPQHEPQIWTRTARSWRRVSRAAAALEVQP
jgi:hypothetical protein